MDRILPIVKPVIEEKAEPKAPNLYHSHAVSYTATCQKHGPPGSAGMPITVDLEAGTVVADTSQSDVNEKALRLAEKQAVSQLLCMPLWHGDWVSRPFGISPVPTHRKSSAPVFVPSNWHVHGSYRHVEAIILLDTKSRFVDLEVKTKRVSIPFDIVLEANSEIPCHKKITT